MKYYPIIIPTLNRYEHLRRLVDSLAKNTYAKETVLYIGLDYPPSNKYVEGWKQIKSYLPTISGFKEVNYYIHTQNLGVSGNNRFLLNEVLKKQYDGYIYTEDDNEFSPCFIDFLNKALNKYRGDNAITSVSGYLWRGLQLQNSTKTILVDAFNAWGYGTWFHKKLRGDIDYFFEILRSPTTSIKCIIKRPSSFNLLLTMIKKGVIWDDACIGLYNILEKKYQLLPSISMVRNWGDDGSGLNCNNEKKNCLIDICKDLTYDLDENNVNVSKKATEFAKHSFSPDVNKIKYCYGVLCVIVAYLRAYPKLNKYRKNYNCTNETYH